MEKQTEPMMKALNQVPTNSVSLHMAREMFTYLLTFLLTYSYLLTYLLTWTQCFVLIYWFPFIDQRK